MEKEPIQWKNELDIATLGAGCFWCVEAIYQQLKGVIEVIPGYAGGKTKNPSYPEISKGKTGHAEVCQIVFDNEVITFDEILEVFWLIHDPTSQNKQGIDIGSQYRSVIFYHSLKQKRSAQDYKNMMDQSGLYPNPICTEISSLVQFYKAENYHINYYCSHKKTTYCSKIIRPKLAKFRIVFKDKLKITEALN
jgi:peptide-methionine (S)-S-oxide reductase